MPVFTCTSVFATVLAACGISAYPFTVIPSSDRPENFSAICLSICSSEAFATSPPGISFAFSSEGIVSVYSVSFINELIPDWIVSSWLFCSFNAASVLSS